MKFQKGLQVKARNHRGTRYLNYKLLSRRIRNMADHEKAGNYEAAESYNSIFKDILYRDITRMNSMYARGTGEIMDLINWLEMEALSIRNFLCVPRLQQFVSVAGVEEGERATNWFFALLHTSKKIQALRNYIIWNAVSVVKILKRRRLQTSMPAVGGTCKDPLEGYKLLSPQTFFEGSSLQQQSKRLFQILQLVLGLRIQMMKCEECGQETTEPIRSVCDHVLCWACLTHFTLRRRPFKDCPKCKYPIRRNPEAYKSECLVGPLLKGTFWESHPEAQDMDVCCPMVARYASLASSGEDTDVEKWTDVYSRYELQQPMTQSYVQQQHMQALRSLFKSVESDSLSNHPPSLAASGSSSSSSGLAAPRVGFSRSTSVASVSSSLTDANVLCPANGVSTPKSNRSPEPSLNSSLVHLVDESKESDLPLPNDEEKLLETPRSSSQRSSTCSLLGVAQNALIYNANEAISPLPSTDSLIDPQSYFQVLPEINSNDVCVTNATNAITTRTSTMPETIIPAVQIKAASQVSAPPPPKNGGRIGSRPQNSGCVCGGNCLPLKIHPLDILIDERTAAVHPLPPRQENVLGMNGGNNDGVCFLNGSGNKSIATGGTLTCANASENGISLTKPRKEESLCNGCTVPTDDLSSIAIKLVDSLFSEDEVEDNDPEVDAMLIKMSAATRHYPSGPPPWI